MKKRTFTVAFKNEVLTFMEAGNSGHRAAQHFSARDHCAYDEAMFHQWWRLLFESGVRDRVAGK